MQNGSINGDMSVSEMCEALKADFTTMTFNGTTGEGQTWEANGMVSKPPRVYVVTNGEYATAE